MCKRKLTAFLVILVFPLLLHAKSVTAIGEAQITNNDTSSAKKQAIVRAKWAALESVSGVQVKVETIVQNARLVDEAIKTEVKGIVSDYNILDEGRDGNTYWVKIRADIMPEKAEKAYKFLSKNTKVTVLLPVIFPNGELREANPLSEHVINELVMKNLEVVDLASDSSFYSASKLETAMKNNNFMELRSIASDFLSGVMLIGKVDTNATANPGKDVGYGVKLPFNVVTGRLTYRLIGEKNGQNIILSSGYVSGRGQGATSKDATYRMIENLKTNVSNRLISTVLEKIKGANSRTIDVVLAGNSDIDKLVTLKNDLNYISWVLSIEDKSVDTLLVKYPEKSLYLATAIDNLQNYKVKNIDNYKIVLEKQ